LPPISDVSGAFASRMLVLPLYRSFLGSEDHALGANLLTELPGILKWAVKGLSTLRARGRFQQPHSGDELAAVLRDIGSDVQAFVSERCKMDEFEADGTTKVECVPDDLFNAFSAWRDEQGYDGRISKPAFGRRLRAVCPRLKRVQTRGSLVGRAWLYRGIRLWDTTEMTKAATAEA
jgi:putative DNA primase/helicase